MSESIENNLLAKLLLLQNMAALLPSSSLSGFVCEGLNEFPGVAETSWENNSVATSSPQSVLLPMRHENSNFGTIKLEVSNRELITSYLPYLKNFAVMMAVILETKRKEHAATTVQDRFFELAPDMLCIANNRGYFVKLSLSWEKVLGFSRETLCSEPYLNFIHPEDVPKTTKAATDAKAGHLKNSFINRYRSLDGTYRWLEWTSFPEEEGQIFAVARDITHSRAAQRELRLAASVYSNTSDAIFVCNTHGEIISVNPAFIKLTNYQESEIINRNISALICSHDKASAFTYSPGLQAEITACKESFVRKKSGECFLALINITSVNDENTESSESRFIYVMRDITAQKLHEDKIQELAFTDPLTGLANRTLLLSRLDQAIAKNVRHQAVFAVLFIDLDNFKSINDSLGHELGDEVLRIQAKRLRGQVRDSETIARMGGDEFVILLETVQDVNNISTFSQKILDTLAKPLVVKNHSLQLTCSIGVSLYPSDGEDRVSLMRNADTAMYDAKALGRSNFRYFSIEMTDKANKRLKLEMELRKAVEGNQLLLHYQPKFNLKTGAIIGAEALVRWLHPERGLLYPGAFIQFAEETFLINDLGEWVIQDAVRQIALWRSQDSFNLPIAINLSTIQFRQTDLTHLALEICHKYGVPSEAIEFEITESTLMDKPEVASAMLQSLRENGFRVAIDDFGTGYSSLSYLKKLPLDVLKIDRSFIQDIHNDKEDIAIVETIIALSKGLKLELIAEGIEYQEHVNILTNFGVESGQGFLFSKPLSAADFFELYSKQVNGANHSPEND